MILRTNLYILLFLYILILFSPFLSSSQDNLKSQVAFVSMSIGENESVNLNKFYIFEDFFTPSKQSYLDPIYTINLIKDSGELFYSQNFSFNSKVFIDSFDSLEYSTQSNISILNYSEVNLYLPYSNSVSLLEVRNSNDKRLLEVHLKNGFIESIGEKKSEKLKKNLPILFKLVILLFTILSCFLVIFIIRSLLRTRSTLVDG